MAFGSLLGHGWKGATKTNARKNKPSVVGTFFVGSECGFLTLGSPLGNPQCLGCRDKTHPNTGSSFLPNLDLLDDSNVREKSLGGAALCLCSSSGALAQSPGGLGHLSGGILLPSQGGIWQ